MRLKKCNAICALLTAIALIVHVGYNIFAYLTFYYNPALKTATATPFLVCVCAHAVMGMCAVFLQSDGTRLDIYQRQNRRTIIQRVSAAFIFPLLIVHLKTYSLLQGMAEGGTWIPFALVIALQLAFYAVIYAHTVTSVSNAFITLGLLGSRQAKDRLDRLVAVLFGALLLLAAFAVVKGQLAMFLPR